MDMLVYIYNMDILHGSLAGNQGRIYITIFVLKESLYPRGSDDTRLEL